MPASELHDEVLGTMRQLAGEGMTMVVVTHGVQFAREVADTVVFMDGGVVLAEGNPTDFFDRPDDPRVKRFLRLIEH